MPLDSKKRNEKERMLPTNHFQTLRIFEKIKMI